jgi:DNA topoisomerase-1
MNATMDKVAALLGNTRTVCRKCCIHPLVMQHWADGRLTKDMETAKKSARSKSGLQASEALFVAWLKKAQRRKS